MFNYDVTKLEIQHGQSRGYLASVLHRMGFYHTRRLEECQDSLTAILNNAVATTPSSIEENRLLKLHSNFSYVGSYSGMTG